VGRARIAEKSDDLACIVDAESLSALGQGSIQRGEAAAAEDETVKDAVGPESSDDLARVVDAKWVGVLGSNGIDVRSSSSHRGATARSRDMRTAWKASEGCGEGEEAYRRRAEL
jgi:hypothetical protein